VRALQTHKLFSLRLDHVANAVEFSAQLIFAKAQQDDIDGHDQPRGR